MIRPPRTLFDTLPETAAQHQPYPVTLSFYNQIMDSSIDIITSFSRMFEHIV